MDDNNKEVVQGETNETATIAALQQRVSELEAALEMAQRKQTTTEHDQLFHITPDLICIAGFDGYFKRINPSWSRVFGWSDDELYAEPFLSFVHPDDVQLTIDAAKKLSEGQTIISFTNRYRCKDGTYRWLEWVSRPIVEEQRTYAVARDITERKQVEIERNQLFQISPELICIAGFDGYFKHINPSWLRVLGWSDDELYAEPFMSFLHPDDVQSTIDAAQQVSEGQTIISFTNRYRCKDGTYRWLEWVSRPIVEEQRTYAVARDITERRQVEAEAKHAALQQQVIEAQRSALRELSTPLIPIADEVVIMPLIGTIDSQRAQQIMETLLEGVAQYQATLAILDITGVQVVDTQVADALIRTAQAVRLLGAQVMLTGIQPQIAQTLVQLEADLSDIMTKSSLQDGIMAALHEMKGS